MASEIRVNKIINRSGLSTVTFSDTGAIVSGIVTANSFSGNLTGDVTGSGANLTSIPAGQLTGTVADARLSTVSSSKLSGALPALDGSALTGVGASFGNSSVNTTGIITATSFVPTTGQLSHRNLIINGAMQVAQRGTSSTTSGYGDVDRWQHEYSTTNEAPTFSQVEVVSSDSGDNPFAKGFSNCARITNGNQTSGLQAGTQINFMQPIEAQNLRNSGWNYNSSSSYITLSYYVKASVSQEYFGFVKTADGSNYMYRFSLGTLTANTWTKITKTIPGNSNLQIDNNNGAGFQVWPVAFYGTNYTGSSSLPHDTWTSWNSGERTRDQATNWYTTNDATFEITGVQLEVGPVATPFEHLSFGEELIRCQRYYETCHSYGTPFGTNTPEGKFLQNGSTNGAGNQQTTIYFRTTKRANPTVTGHYDGTVGSWYGARSGAAAVTSVSFDLIGMNSFRAYNAIGANFAASEQIGHWQAEAEL